METAMTSLSPQDEERRRYQKFATRDAVHEHRGRLVDFYGALSDFNRDHFGEQLREAHLCFGRTAPRSLGHCSEVTGYGAPVQITLNEALVFGTNRDWVVSPWPAAGTRRFIHDLLVRFTVQQYVLEVRRTAEEGYRGFGPLFAAEANRIGAALGLQGVIPRRRDPGSDEPVCAGWPHNVRLLKDAPYYGDDVTEALLDLATGNTRAGRRMPAPPTLGLLELLLYLLGGKDQQKSIERTQQLLIRHIDRLQEQRSRRYPVRRRVEQGLEDVDGSPLNIDEVAFDPAWLAANNGIVLKVAQAIDAWRAFGELPILADALEEAGCDDPRILRHLRERMEHTRGCWALRGLLGSAPTPGIVAPAELAQEVAINDAPQETIPADMS
jgi:hypothetical protein